MVKSEDLHHHALEQLPNLAYCINDNPRWGKEVVIRSSQICILLSCLVLLCLCCEDGALLVVEAWKRSSTIFSCVQSWFCKEMSCCYCCMRFFVCLFVFSWLWFGKSWRFLCVREVTILGFQHYFTMLQTTVLIPSLIILNINGHSVCSSRETLTNRHRKERFRKILIFFLYFLCREMHVKKLFFATALLWFVLCGHCGKIVCCCCYCCCVFSVCLVCCRVI